jgi:hypothetical protein
MSFEISQMILYSNDRSRMLNFLSDVFEFEVNENDYTVIHHDLAFKILSIDANRFSKTSTNDSTVEFTFNLHSQTDFDEIIKKYNFFQYRRGPSEISEKLEIIDEPEQAILMIQDIDHRPWRFEFKKPIL